MWRALSRLSTAQETGLVHDEGPDKDGGYGPYVQSERMKTGIYMKYAKELIEKGEAYYCFCDKERLASLKTEVVEGKEITLYDKHCLHLSKEEKSCCRQAVCHPSEYSE